MGISKILYIFLPSLHDYKENYSHVTFYGERKHKTREDVREFSFHLLKLGSVSLTLGGLASKKPGSRATKRSSSVDKPFVITLP